MSRITIRGSECYLTDIPDYIHDFFSDRFSYTLKGIEYSQKVKDSLKYYNAVRAGNNPEKPEAGLWDGVTHLYKNGRFPIGLFPDVLDYLLTHNIVPELIDYRNLGEDIPFTANTSGISLRPYQNIIARKCYAAKQSSIEVSTGGGKTFIAAEFIRLVGKRTLFIVPSIELLNQTKEILSLYLQYPVSIIGPSSDDTVFVSNVVVSTWQTLASKNWSYHKYLNSVDCLVVDEAQHLAAKELKLIAKAVPAVYRLAMSGTLFREDGADLELTACSGPKIAQVSYTELINQGYLVRPIINFLKFPFKDYDEYDTYQDIYKDYVVNNEARSQKILEAAEKLLAAERKVLIFVTHIEHGNILKKLSGFKFVHSSHPDRRTLIDSFKNGSLDCLISTSILNEGVDIPPIDALILASPSKSLIVTAQRIGRSLRPFENKEDTIVVDTYDDCKYLEASSNRRLSFYKSQPSFVLQEDMKQKLVEEWL